MEEIKKILDYGLETIKSEAAKDPSKFLEFQDVYYKIFGNVVDCIDCNGNFTNAYNKLKEYYSNKLKNPNYMADQTSKFKINQNGTNDHPVVTVFKNGNRYDYTNETMTDDIALSLMAESEAKKAHFMNLPEDIDTQIEAWKEAQKPKAKAPVKDEKSLPIKKDSDKETKA